ncbi:MULTISPECIES: hypothetical protein [unclassified Mannheimia]|uniref:hypothetical protein n=1 Tax=unclassified Mannheimia TaxID=2645054 RepID=UPI00359DB8BC
MHSKFKLTLAALAVSVVLTGCKSSQGPSVIADNPPKQITVPEDDSKAKENRQKSTPPKPQSNKPNATVNTAGNKPQSNPAVSNTPPAKDNIQPAPQSNQTNSDKAPNAVPEQPNTHKKEEEKQPETAETDKTDNAQGNEAENNQAENANNQPVEPPAKAENTDQEIIFVELDRKKKPFRVVNLNPRKSVVNTAAFLKVNHDSFTADSVEDSPFESSDDNKDYNHILAFNLGSTDKATSFKTLDNTGSQLGIHSGIYEDDKIEGDSQSIHYLYVNQPYSSYGALFTNENDSHLFSVHLTAGQSGKNDRGNAYAEYDVFSNDSKWNENLVGNATYKGQTIARVVRTEDGKQVASLPQFDGDVTLDLNLAENWKDSSLSGQINSKTLGKISLNETKISPSSTLKSNLSFGDEATVEGDDSFVGGYDVYFTGPNLEDAVGAVDLENDKLKYNAVFGATKPTN